MNSYRAGMDIGSTTVKLVILDSNNQIVFGEYRRHHANTREAICTLLREAQDIFGNCRLQAKVTGSGSINLAKMLSVAKQHCTSGGSSV